MHARRKNFPAFADIASALQETWPIGDVACVEEIESRLAGKFSANLVEAAIWKVVGDSAAAGHLLVDLERQTLDRKLPLALLPPDAPPLVPDPLPDTLLPEPEVVSPAIEQPARTPLPGPTFDASTLDEKRRDQFHRNLRAVSQVLAGATQTSVAAESGIARTTLSRLVRRTKQLGQIACVPLGTYARKTTMHPAFQECIRRLYILPTQLSMAAIHEHTEMRQLAVRLTTETGKTVKLPSYDQVRREIHRLKSDEMLLAVRRDTLQIIDGAGPIVETPAPKPGEQGGESGAQREQEVAQTNVSPHPTETSSEAGDSVQSANPAKCPFCEEIPIDLQAFADSGTRVVECPDCGANRSLEPHRGVLRFKQHDRIKRKTKVQFTALRWARREMTWKVVGGERR